jgi:hypothetical protein
MPNIARCVVMRILDETGVYVNVFSAVAHNAVQYEGMCPDSLEFNISPIPSIVLLNFAIAALGPNLLPIGQHACLIY